MRSPPGVHCATHSATQVLHCIAPSVCNAPVTTIVPFTHTPRPQSFIIGIQCLPAVGGYDAVSHHHPIRLHVRRQQARRLKALAYAHAARGSYMFHDLLLLRAVAHGKLPPGDMGRQPPVRLHSGVAQECCAVPCCPHLTTCYTQKHRSLWRNAHARAWVLQDLDLELEAEGPVARRLAYINQQAKFTTIK
jgi:hypothetical protein